MSTEFYWDKEQEKLIFTRYASGIPEEKRDLMYVFNGRKNLVDFFLADRERIIYSEYGVPYTIASMRLEIEDRGVIVVDKQYCEEADEQ